MEEKCVENQWLYSPDELVFFHHNGGTPKRWWHNPKKWTGTENRACGPRPRHFIDCGQLSKTQWKVPCFGSLMDRWWQITGVFLALAGMAVWNWRLTLGPAEQKINFWAKVLNCTDWMEVLGPNWNQNHVIFFWPSRIVFHWCWRSLEQASLKAAALAENSECCLNLL